MTLRDDLARMSRELAEERELRDADARAAARRAKGQFDPLVPSRKPQPGGLTKRQKAGKAKIK